MAKVVREPRVKVYDGERSVVTSAASLGLSSAEVIDFLDISPRTYARRKTQPLSASEADRLDALRQLVDATRQLTPDGSPSVEWLRTYIPALDSTPLARARSLGGYAQVLNLISAIRWGHYL
jgi:hypothetical protein